MRVAILSIGTELTRGELVNTNAQWLAEELTGLGFNVVEHTTVADEEAQIIAALKALAGKAGVVIVTGGLGPTSDDMTAQATATAAGVQLKRNQAAADAIIERFKSYGRHMPTSNLKQADIPDGAELLPNPVGTAPGFTLRIDGAHYFFLPGVPSEMRHLYQAEVAPRIAGFTENNSCQLHLRTYGLTESRIADLLADLETELNEQSRGGAHTTIGYRVIFPEIEVKVLTRADSRRRAESEADRVAERICESLGDAVFGGRQDSYPAFVGRILREKRLTLAIAESCTGGLIGKLVTDVPGSSDYLLLDAVAYSNDAKSNLLGVDRDLLAKYGAVSEEAAIAMAEGVLKISGADLAVAVTGIAGPGGGSPEKPVGAVHFALAAKREDTFTRKQLIPGDRDRVRVLSAYFALKMVADAVRRES